MPTTILSMVRVPAAMLVLASILLVPLYSASAQEPESAPCPLADEVRELTPLVPIVIESINQNSDESGTIVGTLEHVPQCLSDATGIQEGDTVTVNYTADTTFMVKRDEVTIDSFEVGQLAFAMGDINFESLVVDAQRIVDRPAHPKYHIREVVEVDIENNVIVMKNLGPADPEAEDEYVYVTYDEDTIFMQDHEEADETAVSVGDKIHVRGVADLDSEEYLAEIHADQVLLFEDVLPRPINGGNHPQDRVTE